MKLPVAPANRPVPPVIVTVSTIEAIPGVAVGVPNPVNEALRVSPLAAVNSKVPTAIAGVVARFTRCGPVSVNRPRWVVFPVSGAKSTDANVDGGGSGMNVKEPSSVPLKGSSWAADLEPAAAGVALPVSLPSVAATEQSS